MPHMKQMTGTGQANPWMPFYSVNIFFICGSLPRRLWIQWKLTTVNAP
jgi:hypothetical protein